MRQNKQTKSVRQRTPNPCSLALFTSSRKQHDYPKSCEYVLQLPLRSSRIPKPPERNESMLPRSHADHVPLPPSLPPSINNNPRNLPPYYPPTPIGSTTHSIPQHHHQHSTAVAMTVEVCIKATVGHPDTLGDCECPPAPSLF
jgi:hypothetical protein